MIVAFSVPKPALDAWLKPIVPANRPDITLCLGQLAVTKAQQTGSTPVVTAEQRQGLLDLLKSTGNA